MVESFFHGLSGLILAIPMAFGLQHNTRLYGEEIEEATAHVMQYNGWFHVVGDVTPNHKECTATDLSQSTVFATERRYVCDLYFEEFSQPASFSIRVSYNAREDVDLIALLDAVFLEGKYEQRFVIVSIILKKSLISVWFLNALILQLQGKLLVRFTHFRIKIQECLLIL